MLHYMPQILMVVILTIGVINDIFKAAQNSEKNITTFWVGCIVYSIAKGCFIGLLFWGGFFK